MSLHFPLPKIRTNGDEFTLSLAKILHFLFLPSHFPSLFLFPIVFGINYRKRFRASYIVREVLSVREREREREIQREREREIDGSDVTIVALKLAMNLHFPLPKIHTLAMSFPLPKIRTFRFSFHTSRLFLQGEVTMVALKFALSSHFPLPKICSPSGFVPPLSNGTSSATSDRKPKTNDQILPSPILFFPSKNWIKLIPKTIGNRKRDCAWGGSGW